MQSRLSNIIAIQNFQEYLKYLIMTATVEPQIGNTTLLKVMGGPTDLPSMVKKESTSTGIMDSEESEEQKSVSAKSNDEEEDSLELRRSQKLFRLMRKNFRLAAESKCENQSVETTVQLFESDSKLFWMSKKIQKK